MNARAWRRCRSGLVAIVTVVCGVVIVAQAADPAYGTWKLNVARSKYSPGPAPKSGMLTIEAAGPGRKVSVEGVAGDGSVVKWGYTANLDSKEYRVTGSNPDAEMVMLKRLSPISTRTTYKMKGKATIVNVLTVSADGKTLRVVAKGVNAAGKTVNNTQVFEK